MTNANQAVAEFQDFLATNGKKEPPNTLTGKERVARAEHAFMDEFDALMAVDMETCVHCGMCAEACPFYETTSLPEYAPVHKIDLLRRFYRRELSPMRFVYRPFTKRITADDLDVWSHLVFGACTECGRCDMMCPMGIGLSALIHVTRQGLAAAGCIPDELKAIEREQRETDTLFGCNSRTLLQNLDELRASGIDIPVDRDNADIMVLTTALVLRVFIDELKSTAKILNKLGCNWTLRSKGFEASNFGLISGDAKGQVIESARIIDEAIACKAKMVLVPDRGHAYLALRWEASTRENQPLPFKVLSMPEFIAEEIAAGRLTPRTNGSAKAIVFNDSCKIGRQGGIYEQPRDILKACGIEIRETDSHEREGYCCGGGCGEFVLRDYGDLRQKVFELKRAEFDATQADSVVTECSACRFNFMVGAQSSNWKKPVESLVEIVADRL
jgi:Fe-S oxidoreductase